MSGHLKFMVYFTLCFTLLFNLIKFWAFSYGQGQDLKYKGVPNKQAESNQEIYSSYNMKYDLFTDGDLECKTVHYISVCIGAAPRP